MHLKMSCQDRLNGRKNAGATFLPRFLNCRAGKSLQLFKTKSKETIEVNLDLKINFQKNVGVS